MRRWKLKGKQGNSALSPLSPDNYREGKRGRKSSILINRQTVSSVLKVLWKIIWGNSTLFGAYHGRVWEGLWAVVPSIRSQIGCPSSLVRLHCWAWSLSANKNPRYVPHPYGERNHNPLRFGQYRNIQKIRSEIFLNLVLAQYLLFWNNLQIQQHFKGNLIYLP